MNALVRKIQVSSDFLVFKKKKIIPFQPTKTGMEGKENYISKLCNYGGMALSF